MVELGTEHLLVENTRPRALMLKPFKREKYIIQRHIPYNLRSTDFDLILFELSVYY